MSVFDAVLVEALLVAACIPLVVAFTSIAYKDAIDESYLSAFVFLYFAGIVAAGFVALTTACWRLV